jgi:peptide/nickel transport system permease protein
LRKAHSLNRFYVNAYDSISASKYTLNLVGAAAKRIASKLKDEDRLAMKEWLVAYGIAEADIDIENTEQLLDLWRKITIPRPRSPG